MPQTFRRLPVILLILTIIAGCSQKKTFVEKLMGGKPGTPEDHWVKTDDGWTLHIRRYPPATIDPHREPVILCHGLSHNNNFWDLTDNTSLAKYLQNEGFDVWAVSLRGCGQSTKPTLSQIRQLFRLQISALNPDALINRQPGLLHLNWTVDDHIRHDIPVVLDYVTTYTKSPKVLWVGHSMGAMIMFAYLGTEDQSRIKGFVAVSAPMYLVHPANDVFELMAQQANFVKIGNLAAGTNFRAIVGSLAGPMVTTPIDQLFLNAENVDPNLLRVFYYANQEDISPGQLDQLLQYVKTGSFFSYDGKINYTESVKKITVPVLQIVGQMDNMVDPGFAAQVNKQIGSKNKNLRVFGKINGYRADYGHDDIILGRYAHEEIFPYVRDWLNSQNK
ncbi:MAG: alpha/beta fold hydrolase [Phycisphaerae bacterium]